MRNSTQAFLYSLLLSAGLFGSIRAEAVIYGNDDRSEANETWASGWSRSVFLMAPRNLAQTSATTTKLDFPIISKAESPIGLCENEKFADQPSAGINCTGFLVAPDLIVTAGHCVAPYMNSSRPDLRNSTTPACDDFVWIADFAFSRGLRSLPVDNWPNEKIFECAEVVRGRNPDFSSAQLLPPLFGDDYAVIRLKQKADGRPVFRISQKPTLPVGPVYALGYPLGQPLKFSGPARILDASFQHFFSTNIDAFMGNSGSPVFDSTGMVHGVLVRGYPEDFVTHGLIACNAFNTCSEDATRCAQSVHGNFPAGEHIQKIAPVLQVLRDLGLPDYKSNVMASAAVTFSSRFGAPAAVPFILNPLQKAKEKMALKARPRTFVVSE